MDYSKMSDVSVNEAVGKLVARDGLTVKKSSGEVFIHEYADFGGHKGICTGWKAFDPCNNAADAWPIIVENNISIILESGREPCALGGVITGHGLELDFKHLWQGDNPLRNAMIVYLQLQEAK
ncbi:phage protein NinX family protein [Pseudescherichia sp.]|uniref:phage protein NinX family protein n=1 Tax=Pseudescherichia sp. TaxID=2055881 RepID=UPI00289D38DD|nr:phage protein NinX family protein [Pseudescherichia sp.]